MEKYELVSKIKAGQLSSTDISVSDWKELIISDDTKEYGLMLISDACIKSRISIIDSKLDKYSIADKRNDTVIQMTSDVVRIEHGEVVVNKTGIAKSFLGYYSYFFDISLDARPKLNWGKLIMEALNVPKKIKIISLSGKVIKQCDYIRGKYLTENGELSLPRITSEGIKSIVVDVENEPDKFFKRMKAMGKEQFFLTAVSTKSGMESEIFNHFGEDVNKLNKLNNKLYDLLK